MRTYCIPMMLLVASCAMAKHKPLPYTDLRKDDSVSFEGYTIDSFATFFDMLSEAAAYNAYRHAVPQVRTIINAIAGDDAQLTQTQAYVTQLGTVTAHPYEKAAIAHTIYQQYAPQELPDHAQLHVMDHPLSLLVPARSSTKTEEYALQLRHVDIPVVHEVEPLHHGNGINDMILENALKLKIKDNATLTRTGLAHGPAIANDSHNYITYYQARHRAFEDDPNPTKCPDWGQLFCSHTPGKAGMLIREWAESQLTYSDGTSKAYQDELRDIINSKAPCNTFIRQNLPQDRIAEYLAS